MVDCSRLRLDWPLINRCRIEYRNEGNGVLGLLYSDAIVTKQLLMSSWTGSGSWRPRVHGKRVLLKPNLVEYSAAACINTNPALIAAVAESLYRLGAASVIVAEGPGHVRDTDLLLFECGLKSQLDAVGHVALFLNFRAGFAGRNPHRPD